MTLILRRSHHHSFGHLEHTNEEEDEEEITMVEVEEQSTDLAFRMQHLILPNVAIRTSTLMTHAPLEDREMEKSKKEG
jgi:hypothetical protein